MPRRFLRSQRGGSAVETLIALVPVMSIFFGAVQYSRVATADLVLKHATVAAARAAIVILNPDANPGANGPESDVVNAAGVAMGPWLDSGAFDDVRVTWSDTSTRANPFGRVTVTVAATYKCEVPLGKYFVCQGSSVPMTFTVTLPHQGAQYRG